jgi:epoxyqueuosine reductase
LDKQARHTQLVKEIAADLGFNACGIAEAGHLEGEEKRLQNWLDLGYHGQMTYMTNHFDKRLDPSQLVPGAKSIISVLYNYYPKEDLAKDNDIKIAKYAYGKDYHFVIKDKLKDFLQRLKDETGEVNGRVFVDSAPVMERQWAQKAGLGWLGKNGLLLNKQMGSFFFIAELIVDLELEYDAPVTDHCGNCTLCIEACPTEAIVQPGVVDGSKCISYYTIELKPEHEIDSKKDFQGWAFGCDICQDVCPWNSHAKPHREPEFEPSPDFINLANNNWQELTQETFNKVFRNSAVKRTKLAGLRRNLDHLGR